MFHMNLMMMDNFEKNDNEEKLESLKKNFEDMDYLRKMLMMILYFYTFLLVI